MATETSIQESVCLKKDEREEIALISECFKEKVTEFPGNKVMQLETSSPVVETVNTPQETGEPTDESGIFVQALSVPMVIADEHSNTPESFKAVKQTEPEEETKKNEEKAVVSEGCEDDAPEKAEHEVGSKLFDSGAPSMKEALNVLEKNQSDSDGVTSSKDAAGAEQHATTVTDFKEQDLNETPREFAKDSNDKSVDAQEASEQCEIRSNDVEEQKSEVSVKKIEQDEEIEEFRPDVEMEKREQNGLSQAITSDACISTQTKAQAETIEHEEDGAKKSDNPSIKEVCEENSSVKAEKESSGMKLDEKAMSTSNKDENEEKEQEVDALEKDQDKDDITSAQEVTFEGGLQEKNHHNEDNEHEVVRATGSVEEDTDVCVSTQTTLVEKIIKNEELHDEKAVEKDVCAENGLEKAEIEISDRMAPSQKETLSSIEKDQGDSDGVTSSQEAPCVDVEETTTVQHATTVIDFKEQDLNEKPKELNGEETEDKSLDAQEASKECKKGAKEDIEENPEESVKNIEKEEETEEIKPSAEIEKEKEQNELLPSITTDVCISTQTESQVEKAEHVEKDTQNDDGLKEKPDSPSTKEVCEEKIEKEEEAKEIKTGVEIEEKKEQNKLLPSITTAVCISTQTESQVEKAEHVEEDTQNDDGLKGKPDSPSTKEVCEEKIEKEEEAKEIKPGVEIKEKKEQNEILSSIPTDVCISTQTESQIEKAEQVEEDTQNDDCLKDKPDSPSIKEVCEEKIEKEEKEIKAGVEIEEKKEQDELLSSISTDVCISRQTESQVEKAEQVEEDTINDDGLKDKPDSPLIKEVCEEKIEKEEEAEEIKAGVEIEEKKEQNELLSSIPTDVCISTQTESQVEKVELVEEDTQNDDGLKEKPDSPSTKDQEVNRLEKYEDKDGVTSAQDMALEKDLQEKNHHNEDDEHEAVTAEESTEKDTEDIRSIEETEQQRLVNSIPSDVCITTQTKPQVETIETNDEEAIASDDGQTKTSGNPMVKEISEENVSKKIESEGLKLSDSSSMALNENDTKKAEDQETEQEIYVSEKSQSGGDDVTSSENASNEEIKETISQHDTTAPYLETALEQSTTHREILVEAEDKLIDVQEENGQYDDGANDEREQKQEESVNETARSCSKIEQEENTKEIKPSVETIEEKDVYTSTQIESQGEATKNEENAIESDGDQKEMSNNPFINEVSEENDLKKTESEEERQLSDSSIKTRESVDEDTKETKSSNEAKENIEQQDEIEPLEVHAGEDDVTSSQNASTEDIKETMNGQHDTTVAYAEEGTGVSALPKDILIGEAEDKSIGAEEVSLELGQPSEQNVEETHPCLSKTTSENSEDEIKKENEDLSHESAEDTNDDTTKEEKFTSKPAPVEEHSGRDEVSKEVTNLDKTTEVEPHEDITPSTPLEISTEDVSNSEKEKAESEILPIQDEVHVPELVAKSEDSVLKEECFVPETETHSAEEKETVMKDISSDEKTELATEINQETVKEVCEETSSEKTELGEKLQLSDSLNVKKEVTTFKDDNQVNISAEKQGDDNITSTQNEVSEEKEELKENNYPDEGNEGGFIKSEEAVDDDAEVIKPSAETKDNTEHVIATNVCSSTQIENNEETVENEDRNGEKAIEYDENETVSRKENLEKKQEDVEEHATTVAYFEEGQSLGAVTKEVQGKEGDKSVVVQEETEQYGDGKTHEREQKPEEHTNEIKPSVETKVEKDVCISTQTESQEEATKNEENVSESDLKKTESEEERQLSDISNVKTRESVDEDTEGTKSSDQTKENVEQQGLLHVISPDVCSSTQTEKTTECEGNNDEETIENKDGQAEKPESPSVQVVREATSSAMVESEEGVKHNDSFSMSLKENETMSKEEKLEKEDEIETSEVQGGSDDVTSSSNASNEDIKETTIRQHDTTVAYVEEGQGVSAVPKVILIEESEDRSIDAKEMSLELGQPNEQNVEETNTRPSKTLSENPEDEIKKEDEDLSLETVEDTNDSATKEEKCTLEHEPVEEHSGQDEVSKEKVPVLNETTEVEPQDDISHSTPLETSTEDASNLEMENIKSENLPIVYELDIPESVPKSEESALKDELFISETETHSDEVKGTVTEEISSDEKTEQTTEINQETIKEVCEETSSEKAEIGEGLELCDSSDMKINKKEITGFKDDNQEKDQDVMLAESQGEDNITNSQNEVSEEKEDLRERTYHHEDDERDFIKTTSVDEDTEEVKPSVETKENTEHVIATNGCSSPQIETNEGTVRKEEKNDENAIENDKNEIVSREENLEKKHKDVSSSAQTETIESEEKNEEATENDDGKENLENQKKEQELEMSKLHDGGDDVISSQNASNENPKETTIDQHVNTMVHSEEGLGVNAITKELIKEEVDDKSIHAQEASEQCEKEAKDKTEQQPEESVNKPENSCSETIDRSIEEEVDAENKEIESNLEAENQADRTEDRSEKKDEAILSEKVTKELGQPEQQNVEEVQACLNETITEKTEEKIAKDGVSSNVSNDSIEHVNECISKEEKCFPDGINKETEISLLEHEPVKEQNEVSSENFTESNETTAVEPQEDVKPSSSLETSTEETSHSDEAKVESEILQKEELESIAEMHIPDVMPKSKGSKMKEECLISATKETTSYENLETHGSTQQQENSDSTTEENVTQVEQTGEINSLNENRDMKEDVTQESQLNSTEDRSEMVKGVILTEEVPLEIENKKGMNDFKEQTVEKDNYSPELEEKSAQNQKEIVHEISNSDSIPAENPEVTEVNVDGQLGQENLQGKEDVSCASKVTNDGVDQEPKEERIPSLEDAATVVSQVNLSNTESTAYPSETEKLAIKALESDCDVQIPEIVADSEDSKVTEECTVLDTADYTDENNMEQDTIFNEIASAPDKEQKNVIEIPTKSDEEKSPDLIEEKAVTKENLDIHGELEPTSEPVIEEDQVAIEMKPQPEQSNITCENIMDEQISESRLEYTSGKKLEDGREDMEEDFTLAPENESKSTESPTETTKNSILTDEVAVQTEKEKESYEIEGQVSEEDNCPTELDNTSTPNQKELENEQTKCSKTIPVGNTEVKEVKSESQIEVENIQGAEDLSCLSKASSIIETSKVEMHEDTEQTITIIGEVKDDGKDEASKGKTIPALEDPKTSELQVNLSELESTDIPSNAQDSMKREDAACRTQETIEEKEDQRSINERCIEEKAQGNFDVEIKDAKSGNETVEDVIIDKVPLEDEKAKESKSKKDIINEDAKLNQLTSYTDEVFQIKSLRPDELEAKDSVEDTEDAKFMADNLIVKDETSTVMKEPNEDIEIVASEFKRLENTMTVENKIEVHADEEKEALNKPQEDNSEKTTEDSKIITEVAEIVPECRKASVILTDNLHEASPVMLLAKHEDGIKDEGKQHSPGDMLNKEKEAVQAQEHISSIKSVDPSTEVEIREQKELVSCGSQEPSEDNTLLSQNDKNTEDPKVLQLVEKDVVDVQKHEKDPDHETKVRIVDVVSNTECSEIEPQHLDAKEATSDIINQEIQREQKKEADESIEAIIPVEYVKTSTKKPEVGSVDLEVPSVMDATADKAINKTVEVHETGKGLLKDNEHLESACNQSKPIEEVSGMKQEPLGLDAPGTLGTAATEDLKISQKSVTDDLIKISQAPPEIQKYGVPIGTVGKQLPNEPHPKESTEKVGSSHEQGEPIAKSLIPEAANSIANKASDTEPQCTNTVFIDQKEKSESVEPAKIYLTDVLHQPAKGNSEVAENLIGERDSALTKDQLANKNEIGESGVQKDEEDDEEEEDNEDDEKMDSCSDAPVMVEASKDMDVKAHKKSHNILSGVGSKVKHSIAKVKKAITGKSSPPKSSSPKAKNQVIG